MATATSCRTRKELDSLNLPHYERHPFTFNWIIEKRLAVGCKPSLALHFEELLHCNVQYILSFYQRGRDNEEMFATSGRYSIPSVYADKLRHQQVFPIRDANRNYDYDVMLAAATEIHRCIVEASANGENGVVYLHCFRGKNRSPTVAALYLWLYGHTDFPTIPQFNHDNVLDPGRIRKVCQYISRNNPYLRADTDVLMSVLEWYEQLGHGKWIRPSQVANPKKVRVHAASPQYRCVVIEKTGKQCRSPGHGFHFPECDKSLCPTHVKVLKKSGMCAHCCSEAVGTDQRTYVCPNPQCNPISNSGSVLHESCIDTSSGLSKMLQCPVCHTIGFRSIFEI